MKKVICVVAICIAVLGVVLSTKNFSFSRAENAIEQVQASSSTLAQDVSTISLFTSVVRDYFAGARYFEFSRWDTGHNVIEGGEVVTKYTYSVRYFSATASGNEGKEISREYFPITAYGDWITPTEAQDIMERMTAPLGPFTNFDRVEYKGAFAGALEALQFIAFALAIIWALIGIAFIVLIDTVSVAWSLITASFKIIGLT